MATIKQILMLRDNMPAEEADKLIDDAQGALIDCLDDGDGNRAGNICEEFFGLGPDYLQELINRGKSANE